MRQVVAAGSGVDVRWRQTKGEERGWHATRYVWLRAVAEACGGGRIGDKCRGFRGLSTSDGEGQV